MTSCFPEAGGWVAVTAPLRQVPGLTEGEGRRPRPFVWCPCELEPVPPPARLQPDSALSLQGSGWCLRYSNRWLTFSPTTAFPVPALTFELCARPSTSQRV